MFFLIIVALLFWLIFDYKKDKKIEKRLDVEKTRIHNNGVNKDQKIM